MRTEPALSAPLACAPLPVGELLVEIQRKEHSQSPVQVWIQHSLGWTLNLGPEYLCAVEPVSGSIAVCRTGTAIYVGH